MPSTTTRRGNRYPKTDRSEAPDVPADMKRLAEDLDDAPKDQQGLWSARPAAGSYTGHFYYATDNFTEYRWNGSAWVPVGAALGDLKHSLRNADHDGWVYADGRTNILRSTVTSEFVALMISLGYVGSDGTHIGVPDYRGRTLVGLGTHADVDGLADNDGLTVASRTPKHRHKQASPIGAAGGNLQVISPGDANLDAPSGSSYDFDQTTTFSNAFTLAPPNTGSGGTGSAAGERHLVSSTLNSPAYGVGGIFVHL